MLRDARPCRCGSSRVVESKVCFAYPSRVNSGILHQIGALKSAEQQWPVSYVWLKNPQSCKVILPCKQPCTRLTDKPKDLATWIDS